MYIPSRNIDETQKWKVCSRFTGWLLWSCVHFYNHNHLRKTKAFIHLKEVLKNIVWKIQTFESYDTCIKEYKCHETHKIILMNIHFLVGIWFESFQFWIIHQCHDFYCKYREKNVIFLSYCTYSQFGIQWFTTILLYFESTPPKILLFIRLLFVQK